MATFLGTDLPTATAGVEQNRHTLTLVQMLIKVILQFTYRCLGQIFLLVDLQVFFSD